MVSSDEVRSLLRALDRDVLLVQVIDAFDFEGSFTPLLLEDEADTLPDRIVLVINKVDLLPAEVSLARLERWVRSYTRGLGDRVKELVFVSGKANRGLDALVKAIDSWRVGNNVYVVGCTNTGKSTLINALQKAFGGSRDRLLTTSKLPGTTLAVVSVPIGSSAVLYDTPGIQLGRQVTDLLDLDEIKVVMPEKPPTPQVFRLAEGTCLLAGGLARFEYTQGPPLLATAFFSPLLPVHGRTIKRGRLLQRGETILTPPFSRAKAEALPLERHVFEVLPEELARGEGGHAFADLYVSGLGWVSLTAREGYARAARAGHVADMVFEVWAPEGVMVTMRDPLLPREAERSVRGDAPIRKLKVRKS